MDEKAAAEAQPKQQNYPSYETNGSNQLSSVKRSNTITAMTVDKSNMGHLGDRRNSFESETKQILSDEDIFSREAIRVAHQFWNDNVMILSLDRRQEIGVTLYAQMFRKMPECRKIFLRGDIEKTSEKFLGMIGWLIDELYRQNSNVWAKVKRLGKVHRSWGISYEHYLPMLEAFHLTFQEQFPKLYTLRVKFCIENLFMNAAKIMTEKDFITLFAERVQDLETLEFLDSLDACLAHSTGREYFERYLEQTFCAEYVSFLRSFDEFKQLGNAQQRYEKAREIYLNHFDIHAHALIDFQTDEQRQHLQDLQAKFQEYEESLNAVLDAENNANMVDVENTDSDNGQNNAVAERPQIVQLNDNLLDALYSDVKQIIEENSWDKFHAGIYSIKTATRITNAIGD